MTPPAKAGGFSGNGMTCSEGVAVYRSRLKAPSGPLSERTSQDVQRGVQVPTDAHAAGTVMPALSQGLWDVLAAARTALRRAGWVHLDQRPPSFFRFGGQDRDELAPASVVNGLRQHRTGQSLQIRVFDGDHPVLLHEHVRRLVVEVASLTGDVDVHPRDFLTPFEPTARPFLSPRQFALCEPQSPLSQAEVPLICDLPTVTEDGERGQSNVDANSHVARWQRLGLGHLDAEAHEPTACLSLGGHGFDLSIGRQRTVPLQLEVAHALQVQATVGAHSAPVSPTRPGERVVAKARTKARVAR